MLETVTGAGSNHENLDTSFDGASDIIMAGLNALCEKAGIALADVSFTLMGLAGIDHEYQYDIMCAKLREKGLENFEVFNDGFIVVKAGATGKSAIGYNCGTGVCCNGIDVDGKRMQLAGLGDFSGDISGGGNIVIEAFRLVYNELFLGLEKTLITDMVMNKYGFKDRGEVLGLIEKIEGENGGDYIRDMVGSITRPIKELKGFEKITLKPGETKTVTFTLEADDLSFYSIEKNGWVAEAGEFQALIGPSSVDIRTTATFELK